MENLEQGAWGRLAEEEARKHDKDQHFNTLRKQEEELMKKHEDEQLIEALRRSKMEQKVKADCQSALLNSNKIQIVTNLRKDLKKVTPPMFHGRAFGEDAKAWITSMEKYFLVWNYTWRSRAVWATYQLMGEVATWWENVMAENKIYHGEVTWEEFLQLFRKWWLP